MKAKDIAAKLLGNTRDGRAYPLRGPARPCGSREGCLKSTKYRRLANLLGVSRVIKSYLCIRNGTDQKLRH